MNAGGAWKDTKDEDFERKLLMHCEDHALSHETSVDKTFDDDDDDEISKNVTIFQVDSMEQNDIPPDDNIIYSVHDENEAEIEVTLLRLCEACAMDVTDVEDFVDQCPFCMAAKIVDLDLDESRGCDFLHRMQPNVGNFASLTLVDGMNRLKESYQRTSTATNGSNKNQVLKGMVSTFLQQNNKMQQQLKTRVESNKDKMSSISESRDDISQIIRPKTIFQGRKESLDMSSSIMERRLRLHKLKNDLPCSGESRRVAKSRPVESIDVRYQLLQLNDYYSRQQK